MPYEITANRKRPQSFDQLIGQDFVVSTLKNSLSSGRLAHAYLFSGPRGVGKTSAARILARCLNCVNGPTEDPCGVCENCKEIARGNSLDVVEIDGASNTSVNDIREIKDEVLFAPNTSSFKIYIIDEVHMLSSSAFNALLKTIEEPPPYIVFIFATTEIHKVPATIRSRCQQFTFRLISIDEMKEMLAQVTVEMEIQADEDALFWVAKEATGSFRDAYTLFDQIVAISDGKINLKLIREKLGLVGPDQINRIAELLATGNAKEALESADEVLNQGVSIEQFVMDIAEYFRNLLFVKHGIRKEALLGGSPDRFSSTVLNTYSPEQLETALDLGLALFRDLRYSLNQRFELELFLCRLSVLSDRIHPKDILDRIRKLKDEITRDSRIAGVARNSTSPPKTKKPKDDTEGESKRPDDDDGRDPGGGSGVDSNPGDQTSGGADDAGLSVAMETKTEGDDESSAKREDVNEQCDETQREEIVKLLKRDHLSLASALEKTNEWSCKGDIMFISSASGFQADTIMKEAAVVAQAAESVLGRRVRIEAKKVAEDKGEGGKAKADYDDRVELVRRIFRGEIVDERG